MSEKLLHALRLRAQLSFLEATMGTPGFWDDEELAAKASAEHARTSREFAEVADRWHEAGSDGVER